MPQQFKQNPLEQFEPENLSVGWPWRFFLTSFFIFLAAMLVYLGLVFGYEPYLQSQIEKQDQEINSLAQTVSKSDQDKFIQFYSQISNLKKLLENHILASKIFPFLEKNTNQKVYYKVFNLKVPEYELELEGVAESYAVLAEQLESFNQAQETGRYILNQSKFNGREVEFGASLELKQEIFK